MRRVALFVCAALAVFALSGCSGAPPGRIVTAPSSATPSSTVESPAVAAAILAESSYRFTVAYTVPARDLGDFEIPAENRKADGMADPGARVLRAEGETGQWGDFLLEVLVIGDEAWTRVRVDGDPMGWTRSVGTMAFDGLHPWRIPAALALAEDVRGGPDEYTGTIDLSTGEVEQLASAMFMFGADLDAGAVPFTLTLGPDGRPTAFRFETEDGALSASYEFSDYGVAVHEEPPADDELAGEPGGTFDPEKIKCLENGKIVDCPDVGGDPTTVPMPAG